MSPELAIREFAGSKSHENIEKLANELSIEILSGNLSILLVVVRRKGNLKTVERYKYFSLQVMINGIQHTHIDCLGHVGVLGEPLNK